VPSLTSLPASALERFRFLLTSSLRASLNSAGVRPSGIYEAMGELARRYELPAEDLTQYELKVFSQNGEDGVIAEILRRIDAPSRTFVEFGIGNGTEGNCVFLDAVLGWKGTFIERDEVAFDALARRHAHSSRVNAVRAELEPSTVEATLLDAGVGHEPDVASIDVDGNDYHLWEALETIRPRLVVIEYNARFDPGRVQVQSYSQSVADGSDRFGASLGALRELGKSKGYRLVHTELAGVNAFFVRHELANDRFLPEDEVPVRPANYYLDDVTMHIRDAALTRADR
jgi:hypothetical protein